MPRRKKEPTEPAEPKEKKPRKVRELTDVDHLAIWFVTEFLGREMDYRTDTRYLLEAKLLLKPPTHNGQKPTAYTIDQVKACLEAMRGGVFPDWHGVPNCLRSVLWLGKGTKSFIERNPIPPAPPIYQETAYNVWKSKYGNR